MNSDIIFKTLLVAGLLTVAGAAAAEAWQKSLQPDCSIVESPELNGGSPREGSGRKR